MAAIVDKAAIDAIASASSTTTSTTITSSSLSSTLAAEATVSVIDGPKAEPIDMENVDTEDQYVGLAQWWERNCKEFSTWYLARSEEEQRELLQQASPDMPDTSAYTREAAGENLRPTDIVLPELSVEALLAHKGRLLILFFTRRCVAKENDLCYYDDVKFLNSLRTKSALPLFTSADTFKGMDTPFVDPMDPEENIRSLSPGTSTESRTSVQTHLCSGRLVHALVWLALKIRRATLVTFLVALVRAYERQAALAGNPPSPTLEALIRGEIEQQREMERQQAQFQEAQNQLQLQQHYQEEQQEQKQGQESIQG